MALRPKARENNKLDQTFITPNSVSLSHSPTLPVKLKLILKILAINPIAIKSKSHSLTFKINYISYFNNPSKLAESNLQFVGFFVSLNVFLIRVGWTNSHKTLQQLMQQ